MQLKKWRQFQRKKDAWSLLGVAWDEYVQEDGFGKHWRERNDSVENGDMEEGDLCG